MKNRVIIWLLLALCLGGVTWLWLATRNAPAVTAPTAQVASQPEAAQGPSAPSASSRDAAARKPVARTPRAEGENPDAALWEKQIDDMLRANVDEGQTARKLIALLPTMPDEGKVEAVQHIVNLLPDADYRQLMPILLNPHMPDGVHEAIFTDLMNRDDELKLHAFVDIAKVTDHPLRAEALSDLQIFLSADYGSDWAKWNAAIDTYVGQDKKPEQ
jgi:hypothetical protein